MAQVITLANNASTLTLAGEIITDLVEDDQITISWPNPRTARTNAAGNGLTVLNAANGNVCQLTFKVQKYSSSDTLVNSWLKGDGDFPKILDGSLRTRLMRDGVEVTEVYQLEAGTFTDQSDNAKNANEADGEIEYTIEFRNGTRSL